MKDRIDLFFKGGLTIRPAGLFNETARTRIMRKVALVNRLPFTGRAIAITTQRAAQRAKGSAIIEGEIVSRKIQKSLIASGVSRKEAARTIWESMWGHK